MKRCICLHQHSVCGREQLKSKTLRPWGLCTAICALWFSHKSRLMEVSNIYINVNMEISSERTAFKISIYSFFRIGSIILALHDASDVFMEAAKVFKYSEKELAASVFFGFFAISWLILRLLFFPFWVIKATSYDLLEVLNLPEAYPTFLYYLFNTMLLMLLVFHIYWWLLICSMIQRQLKNRGKVGEDIRSDSEDDE